METALESLEAAYTSGKFAQTSVPKEDVWLSTGPEDEVKALSELDAKQKLCLFGLNIPKHVSGKSLEELQDHALTYPLAC